MKQRNRLLALLMALCLLASLAVVPAAAAGESVETLTAQLEEAKKDFEAKKSALETAEADVAKADQAVKDLKAKETQAGTDKNNAQAVLDSETSTEDEKTEARTKITEINAKLIELGDSIKEAENTLETVKNTADVAGKTQAKNEAEKKVTDLEKELEDAKKAEETPTTPTTPPSSGDFYCPSSVDFGKLAKGTTSTSDLTRDFTVTNNSKYTINLSVSSVSGYTVSASSSTLSAGSSATVTVRLNSTSAVGSYNGTLTISASFENGAGASSFSVVIYAEVVESGYSLAASPASKDFGKLAEGYEEKTATDMAVTVTIENKGASSVQMNGVKGNDHFTVTAVKSESVTLKNGEKAEYKVSPKKGMAVGTYTDTITFQTREGATTTFKATVAVEKKLDPLSVTPANLSFGTVEEGYAAITPQTVTLKNNTDRAILLTQPTSYSYEISPITQSALNAGASISFTIRPRTGLPANTYTGDIYISGNGEQAKLNVQFLVTRPAGPTTFSDVPSDSTFAADIAYVSQKGLMSGKGNGNFKPQDPITRGQLVTILYRLEGQPAVSGVGFSDVAAGSYCEKAVKWAAATGITTGGNDGLFRPDDSITREQLATFLYRYNRHKGYFTLAFADLSTFPDVGQVSSYAKDALSWANGAKLVNGTGDGRLNPSGGATRGQAAPILHRYCTSIGR